MILQLRLSRLLSSAKKIYEKNLFFAGKAIASGEARGQLYRGVESHRSLHRGEVPRLALYARAL